MRYKLKLIEYETHDNAKEGFEIDNLIVLFDDLIVPSNRELSCKELLKKCHNQKIFGLFANDTVKIDFRRIYIEDMYPFVEIFRKDGRPEGRLEIVEMEKIK